MHEHRKPMSLYKYKQKLRVNKQNTITKLNKGRIEARRNKMHSRFDKK